MLSYRYAFKFIIKLSEPIKIIKEISQIQSDTEKMLIRNNTMTSRLTKYDLTDEIIVFDSHHGDLHNFNDRFTSTDFSKIKRRYEGLSMSSYIAYLKSLYDDLELENDITTQYIDFDDEIYDDKKHLTKNQLRKRIMFYENKFKIEFVDQFIFTKEESLTINLIKNHPIIKNKIMKMYWIEQIEYS